MAKITYLFKRKEKKYLIPSDKYERLLSCIKDKITPDSFGKSKVMNCYLDTDDYVLIRNSIEGKIYKEKLRVRCYGVPKDDSLAFLELKKKYKGIVYKRRISLSYKEACDYVYRGIIPCDSQIMREIDYCKHFYGDVSPRAVVTYDREAFFLKEDKGVRITFDRNVMYRTDNPSLKAGSYGQPLLDEGYVLMEIKVNEAIPLWLSHVLDECDIYPVSFSKYGKGYMNNLYASIK